MHRPIVWASGILCCAAVSAVGVGSRLNEFAEPRAAVQTQAPAPSGPRNFTIAADYRGHFIVHPTMNQFRIRMLVDTGASLVTLTDTDARNLGIKPKPGDYRIRMSTANGTVVAAKVYLEELTIGNISIRGVEAVVMPAAALDTSLLGMSFLKRLSSFEIAAGRLILKA